MIYRFLPPQKRKKKKEDNLKIFISFTPRQRLRLGGLAQLPNAHVSALLLDDVHRPPANGGAHD